MENNPLDDQLRDLLSEYKSGEPASTAGKPDTELHNDNANLILPEDQEQAWKRIEASLDAADQSFDENVSQRVKNYQTEYDPHAWPAFLNHWNDSRYLRTKLIVMKTVEVAAVLLILLTVFNMGRMGKLPFEPDIFKEKGSPSNEINSEYTNPENRQTPIPPANEKMNNDFTMTENGNQHSSPATKESIDKKLYSTRGSAQDHKQNDPLLASRDEATKFSGLINSSTKELTANSNPFAFNPVSEIPIIAAEGIQYDMEAAGIELITAQHDVITTEPIASVDLIVDYRSFESVPGPKFIAPISRSYTEFGILVQSDYNALRMPEDRLYSSGQQITFPSKGILSPGFGAGFTVAIGHPVWAVESGVIYSAKNFKPGRQLIVGGAFDNGSVDFGAMKLQLVTVPLQYRYRFDHTGRFKTYITAGGGFHLIAQSDIDVQIKYHFASLSFGENPNNDPALAQTIQESRRVRDHILDGAPFRTKSFVSANAGVGLEYMLSPHKAFFLQSIIQYQIPGLQFSNNNGKHLRSVSLQAGVRGPLGK